MSASNKPRPAAEEDLFEEPDYDKFTDEQLDALYRGESIDSVKQNTPTSSTGRIPADALGEAANEDMEPEEIDPALEKQLRAEMDDEDFDDDSDWDSSDHEFDEL